MTSTYRRGGAAVAAALLALPLLIASAVPAVAAGTDFTLDTFTDDNARAVEIDGSVGDDGGFTAITSTSVLQTGDTGLAAYPLDLSAPTEACDAAVLVWEIDTCGETTDNRQAALFSDISTHTAYLFEMTGVDGFGTFSGFWALDSTGALPVDLEGTRVALSAPITVDATESCAFTASGWGRALVWDSCTGVLYDIELPSGDVTVDDSVWNLSDFDAEPLTSYSEAGSPFYIYGHGVAEVRDGRLWMTLIYDGTSIVRFGLQEETATTQTVHTFPGSIDAYAFAVSPQSGRWCTHIEGMNSTFPEVVDLREALYCADLTATVPTGGDAPADGGANGGEAPVDGGTTTAAPELAETGSAPVGGLAVAALLVVLLGGVITMRRRTATTD